MPELIELTFLVPLILALIAALRLAGLADKWTPLVAILLGIVLAVIAVAGGLLTFGLVPAAFGGALTGAGAVGLHQVPKQLYESRRPPRQTIHRGDPAPDDDPSTTDR